MAKGHIKVNLPYSLDKFIDGNGEGVWVIVDAETKAIHDKSLDTGNEVFTGILDNDSVYYPKLKCGDEVRFVMRGKNRPVALMEFLANKGRISEAKLQEIMNKVYLRQLLMGGGDGSE